MSISGSTEHALKVSESRIKQITRMNADWGSAGRTEDVANTDAISRAEDADWEAQVGQRSQVTQTP